MAMMASESQPFSERSISRLRSASGRQAEIGERRRQRVIEPLHDDDVARGKNMLTQTSARRTCCARYRQQIDAVALAQAQLFGVESDHRRAGTDDGLHGRHVAGLVSGITQCLVAGKLELLAGDQRFHDIWTRLHDQSIARRERPAARRDRVAALAAQHFGDDEIAFADILDIADRPVHQRGAVRHAELRRVAADVELFFFARPAAPVCRQQAPADGEKQNRDQRERQPDPDEIEHGEGRRAGFLAHGGDEQVGRGADQGHRAPDQRGERQRHEVERGRLAIAPRRLDGDRQEYPERADILDEGGEKRDAGGQRPDAQACRRRAAEQGAHGIVEYARARDGATDDQNRGDDDDDGARKALEGLVRLDDAGGQRREQRAHRDDIEAPLVPDEEAQHGQDDDRRFDLDQGHRQPRAQVSSAERSSSRLVACADAVFGSAGLQLSMRGASTSLLGG